MAENLIKQRAVKKGQVTRIKTFCTSFDEVDTITLEEKGQLEFKLETLQRTNNEFEKIQAKIECIDALSEEELREHQNYAATFEDDMAKLVGKIKLLISKYNKESSSASSSDSNQNSNDHKNISNKMNMQYPVISLPTFDGNASEWVDFKDFYKSVVHDKEQLSDVEKFYYLQSALKGEAKSLLDSVGKSAANYSVIWETLVKRYDNSDIILNTHLRALFEQPPQIKESASSLRSLLDNTTKHLRCLKKLDQPTEHWDTLIIYLVTSKLSSKTRSDWEFKRKSLSSVKFSDLCTFIQQRWEILESLQQTKSEKTEFRTKQTVANISIKKSCALCKGDHYIYTCNSFLKQKIADRIEEAKRLKLCMNCLNNNHTTSRCNSKRSCKTCNRNHNSLLHLQRSYNEVADSVNKNQKQQSETINSHSTSKTEKLLATAVVEIMDNQGTFHKCRALLDSGSQENYLTNSFCKKLNLLTTRANTYIAGINKANSKSVGKTQVQLHSRINNYYDYYSCLVIETIVPKLPLFSFDPSSIKIPKEIELADPEYYKSNSIDMLIGIEHFYDLHCNNQIKLGKNQPVLQKTLLGWIITGPTLKNTDKTVSCVSSLDFNMKKFWEIEQISNKELAITEHDFAEKHFISNTTRDINGQFIVTMPFKKELNLGNSRFAAEKRFYALESKLNKTPKLKQSYASFLNEYLSLGHMRQISNEETDKQVYYMPHHCVIREASLSTKLRVVFDASAKCDNGISLNDLQIVGPPIQSELFEILLNFRIHKYVFSADIPKMYRQIKIHPSQTCLQRILWRDDINENLKCFELQTLTYGTASAPFLATRCLKQLSIDFKDEYPIESKILETDIYMDDILTGSDSLDELCSIKENITKILQTSGFSLHKFASNNCKLLNSSHYQGILEIPGEENKTLGITWNSKLDTLQYAHTDFKEQKLTKRSLLSFISKLFDPLGLLSPYVILHKVIIQNLWQSNCTWDEEIPTSIKEKFLSIVSELPILNKLKINRLATQGCSSIELHGFADASQTAYGACVYIKTKDAQNTVKVNLLTAKSRVCPLKQLTIPRLELSAALLLVELLNKIKGSIKQKISQIYLWSDSKIVLAWLSSPPSKWKTFVSNRVSEIQSHFPAHHWNHVRSEDNPADLISRGVKLSKLINNKLWWYGPEFIAMGESWPGQGGEESHEDIPEKRTTVLSAVVIKNELCDIFNETSSFTRLQRIMGYIGRFISNLKTKKPLRVFGNLSAEELNQAKLKLVYIAQQDVFQDKLEQLQSARGLRKNSEILSLNPYIDKNGLLRVGGRLNKLCQSNNQLILDSKHKFTIMLARHIHDKYMHCGSQMLLYQLRQEFWPIGGRNFTRKIVKTCVICFKFRPKAIHQIMADLPLDRITPASPFTRCGTDFAGPIMIKSKKGRGSCNNKAYICLFVCLAVKAYHIEIVSDLSTQAFIAAFRRFISRRGKPDVIYSDNGTNFVGAQREIKELYKYLRINENFDKIHNALADEGITWKFLPARSPHMGGIWESGIKSIKMYLNKIIAKASLTFEELVTVTHQIEAILNSRPLSPMSSDHKDFAPLTPGHFLIGRPLTALPCADFVETPENRLSRFQLLQKLVQTFWNQWHLEYLNHLQPRSKWRKAVDESEIKVGALVLLKDTNVPPQEWRLGRIQELHKGSDNIVRVVTIRLANGSTSRRALSNICILPNC